MKTSSILYVTILVITTLMIGSCARIKNVPAKGELVNYPTWWNTQLDQDYVCAYGMATKASQTASIDAAKANAILDAAQFVETEVQGMIKNYEEEAGVFDPQVLALSQKVVKAVSSVEFSGIITDLTETRRVSEYGGPRYTTYLQIKIPKTEVEKNLLNNIRNEEALYNQFKASQAFEELEYSVPKD